MKLFDISEGKVVVTAEAIALPCINKLWEDTKDKSLFYKYISYIVFKVDWNSPYKAFSDDIRESYILHDVFGDKSFIVPENVLITLVEFERFIETPSTRLLKAAEEGVEFLIKEYEGLKQKQGEVDKLGKPIITAEQVGKWLGQLAGAIKSLEALREQVKNEKFSTGTKIRGGSELNYYETVKR